jgi:hypothetical protein
MWSPRSECQCHCWSTDCSGDHENGVCTRRSTGTGSAAVTSDHRVTPTRIRCQRRTFVSIGAMPWAREGVDDDNNEQYREPQWSQTDNGERVDPRSTGRNIRPRANLLERGMRNASLSLQSESTLLASLESLASDATRNKCSDPSDSARARLRPRRFCSCSRRSFKTKGAHYVRSP